MSTTTTLDTTQLTMRTWRLFAPPATMPANERVQEPLRWHKGQRIGINGDLFHEAIPDEFIARVYGVMVAAYWHEFQVLTKRPERRLALLRDEAFRELVAGEAAQLINTLRGVDRVRTPGTHSRSYVGTVNLASWNEGAARNIWEGVSAENQEQADERIPELLATPAAVRWLSCEPLLGWLPLDDGYSSWLTCNGQEHPDEYCLTKQNGWPYGHFSGIDWVIVGGESGQDARPCDLAWIRGIVRQCQAARVPVFVKQLGAKPLCVDRELWERDGRSWETIEPTGARVPMKMRDPKGGEMWEWPEDLRVREFPEVGR